MRDEIHVAVPTVHLNGTGREGLVEPLRAALSALRAASRAVESAAPNARDYYYPQGAGAYEAAAREHASRLAKIEGVARELSAIWEGIENQGR
jgi:hypothetical protein